MMQSIIIEPDSMSLFKEKKYIRGGLTVIYWYWYVGWNTGTKKDNSKWKNAKQNKKDNSSLYSTQGHWFRYLLPLIPLYKNFMYEMPVTQNLWYVKQ